MIGGHYHSCLMLDVCYDTEAGVLLFYTDGAPVLVDYGLKYNFTEPLVLLEAVRRCLQRGDPLGRASMMDGCAPHR